GPALGEDRRRAGWLGPVPCPSHVDAVPRRAVRKVGPRPDLTRSTHIGEPCGPARLLGDGSRSSCSPYRATNQSTGGGGMKNGGSNPPAPGNRCVGAPGRPIVPSRGLLVLFCPMLTLPLAAAALGAWAYGTYEPNSPLFGRAIGRGSRAGRVAYLTFDDGPNPGATEPILHTLETEGVPAAFFMVGEDGRRCPEIRRRVGRKLRPGAIVLLHDGDGYDAAGDRRPTAAALPGIIADARAAGYVFRPLGELVR